MSRYDGTEPISNVNRDLSEIAHVSCEIWHAYISETCAIVFSHPSVNIPETNVIIGTRVLFESRRRDGHSSDASAKRTIIEGPVMMVATFARAAGRGENMFDSSMRT